MNQNHPSASGLLALGIAVALHTSALAGTDTPSASLLMSEAEIAAHKSTMATLEGRAREEYRDAQYQQLRQRAREQGLTLPEQPPWANAAATATTPGATAPAAAAQEKAAAEAVARHDAMRQRLQAQQAAQTDVMPAPAAPSTLLAETQSQTRAQAPAQETPASKAEVGNDDLPAVSAPAQAAAVTEPAPSAPAVEQMPVAPAAAAHPAAPPTAPARPAASGMTGNRSAPVFAPVEVAPPEPVAPLEVAPIEPVAPVEVASPAPIAPAAAPAPSPAEPPSAATAPVTGDNEAMEAYRANMRAQFDEYMQQRQEQMEENARRQREQHQAEMEKRRAMRANRGPYAPYPFPAAPPSYGPRYPTQYPGYRTPYWQQ